MESPYADRRPALTPPYIATAPTRPGWRWSIYECHDEEGNFIGVVGFRFEGDEIFVSTRTKPPRIAA